MRGSIFRAVCSADASGRSSCVRKTTGALGSKAPSCRCDDKDKSRLDNKEEVGVITGCCQEEHVELSSGCPQKENMGGATRNQWESKQGKLLHDLQGLVCVQCRCLDCSERS